MTESTDVAIPNSTAFSIVVGLDFTDADGSAFDHAARLAQRVPRSELHLVHVFREELSQERSRELVDHLRLYVTEKAAIVNGPRGITVGIHLRTGKPVRELAQVAADVHADLIVVGSHKVPHLRHWAIGSTAERLVLGAPCPVLVASMKPTEPEKHEPTIEPACPQCVQARIASKGTKWWCERHSNAANGAHTYSYQRELPFVGHDSTTSPTGIDF